VAVVHPAVVLDAERSRGLVGTALGLDPSLAVVDAVTCLAEVAADAETATSYPLDVVNETSCQDVVVRPVDQGVDAVIVTSYVAGGVANGTSCPDAAVVDLQTAVGLGCSLPVVVVVVLVGGVVTCLGYDEASSWAGY